MTARVTHPLYADEDGFPQDGKTFSLIDGRKRIWVQKEPNYSDKGSYLLAMQLPKEDNGLRTPEPQFTFSGFPVSSYQPIKDNKIAIEIMRVVLDAVSIPEKYVSESLKERRKNIIPPNVIFH
ncbi:MAG: hypothetical protein KJ879_01555 [Nanoarchaeota archaeon]|nr:hypothetical protein [Nanoarchaeota archaeon]